jgi:hypothetical protein
LAEALRTETIAKRWGANSEAYILSLADLARAHLALGHYSESARMFSQVLVVRAASGVDPAWLRDVLRAVKAAT